MTDALHLLRQRVARLDAEPIYADRYGGLDADIAHLVRTMQAVVAPGVVTDPVKWPRAAPADADLVVSGCRLLQRLGARAPAVVAGSLERGDQVWVATGTPDHLPPRSPRLESSRLVLPRAGEEVPVSTKPFGFGLYTSTPAAVAGGFGMWWALLELNRGSTLTPLPWHVWSLSVQRDARVLEVASAEDWAQLVATYGMMREDLLYPDWARVAADWDGVHMTVRAVVATQGICLHAGHGLAAAPYWDVESTLWLRWVFQDQRLVHVERGEAGV